MTAHSGIDWEDAFQNGDYIPGSADLPARWEAEARAFRESVKADLDIPYGAHPRQRIDLFHPETAPKGLLVFIHGGYWLKFDKSYWSHLAAGPLARGWAVALPSYVLAPEARIAEIARMLGQAVATAAERIADVPIHLTGHSAGGHLTARLACADGPLPPEAAPRLARAVPISGLFDLRPLMLHSMNEGLRLDADEAEAESPALLSPRAGVSLTAWVGAAERPEFLRQTRLISEKWGIPDVYDEGLNHFTVIEGLTRPDSILTEALCGA